jgi:hypothetical protein
MSPHVVDFNSDGILDIVVGTYDGSPHLSLGSSGGFSKPEHILDSQGRRILMEAFWDYDAEPSGTWKNTDGDHCISAMAFDWDNDGDFDLLLGSYDGKLFRQMNQGNNGEPVFTGENIPVLAGDKPVANQGGMTAPRLVDWNSDGLIDLVCGSFGDPSPAGKTGGIYLYRNTGALGNPKFDPAETLIPPGDSKPNSPLRPDEGLYVDAADFNADGALDLIVGGYSHWTPLARELTTEQEARIEELDAEIDEATREISAFLKGQREGLSPEELQDFYDKMFKNPEYIDLNDRMSHARRELSELRPGSKREAGVWLYLRNK